MRGNIAAALALGVLLASPLTRAQQDRGNDPNQGQHQKKDPAAGGGQHLPQGGQHEAMGTVMDVQNDTIVIDVDGTKMTFMVGYDTALEGQKVGSGQNIGQQLKKDYNKGDRVTVKYDKGKDGNSAKSIRKQ